MGNEPQNTVPQNPDAQELTTKVLDQVVGGTFLETAVTVLDVVFSPPGGMAGKVGETAGENKK